MSPTSLVSRALDALRAFNLRDARLLAGAWSRRGMYARRFPGVLVREGAFLTENCTIDPPATVGPYAALIHCSLGRYSYLAQRAWASDAAIGRFCSIGPNTVIGAASHPVELGSTSPVFFSRQTTLPVQWPVSEEAGEHKPVTLGSDVWIGANAVVLPGVTIGHGAIIGAGAVVTKDIPAFAIATGIPARPLRFRFSQDQIASLLRLQWWNRPVEWLRAEAAIFQDVQKLIARLEETEAQYPSTEE